MSQSNSLEMCAGAGGAPCPPFSRHRKQLTKLGYIPGWRLFNASDYGVSQLHPRVALVGIRKDIADGFALPEQQQYEPATVGELLHDLMAANK